jgi:hypothetical protein
LEAGADFFLLKPIPAKKEALKEELSRLLLAHGGGVQLDILE